MKTNYITIFTLTFNRIFLNTLFLEDTDFKDLLSQIKNSDYLKEKEIVLTKKQQITLTKRLLRNK